MPDQTITLTLHEKQASENFIKISYKLNDSTDAKETQLTGDQAKDNDEMNKLFSDLLPQDWIEEYKTINSQVIQQHAKKQTEDEEKSKHETNAEILKKTRRGTFFSDTMSVPDIISALLSDGNKLLKIMKFEIYVIRTLLNKLNSQNYNKYINSDIIPAGELKTAFEKGTNLVNVNKYLLDMVKKEESYNDDKNLIEKVFTPEFLKQYAGNITTWGREVLLNPLITDTAFSPMSKLTRGGNNSTQKTHKLNKKNTTVKNK